MQQKQNNRYPHLLLQTLELFQSLVPSKTCPKNYLDATISDLIKFTPCEKQKYQVTFVTKNKNMSLHLDTTNPRTVSNLKAHLVHLKCPWNEIFVWEIFAQ